jgi:digeranylgeranylglycerophospholipid reductase
MRSKYDVVVVGGGPAGLTAARFAAQHGAEVLLMERYNQIGDHICCAEAVTFSGLTAVVEPQPSWICSRISGIKLFSPGGDSAFIDHPDAGYTLDRAKFEKYLAKLAEDRGVEIVTGCRAERLQRHNNRFSRIDAVADGETRTIEYRILIAADGVESTIAREAGLTKSLLPSRLASCAQYRLHNTSVEPEIPELYFDHAMAPGGYAWIFPKSGNSANVGLGVIPPLAGKTSPFEYLDRFLRRKFESYTIGGRMMGIVPLFEGRKSMLKDNLVVAGDAARLIDSLTGAGIATALFSGKIAGELAATCIAEQEIDVLKEYPKRFMKVFGRRLRLYSLAHEVFRRLRPDEFDFIIGFAEEIFGSRRVYAIDAVDILKQVFKRKPGLLKYAPHLVWR